MDGRVAFVTGGSRGIGLAIARRLQADGERVALTYRSEPPPELAGAGAAMLALRCDVTDPAQVEAAFSEIEAGLGPVDEVLLDALPISLYGGG